ncbi:MAG: hypothetical protein JWQ07_260 [Ramlibacter sp.]|nr:hypothetical protein [Ramlibacter sp.]
MKSRKNQDKANSPPAQDAGPRDSPWADSTSGEGAASALDTLRSQERRRDRVKPGEEKAQKDRPANHK